jgi:uncharacterized protein (DUF1501 family)
MRPSRRDFLRLGFGSASLLACGSSVPAFLARSAQTLAGETKRAPNERILVVVQLDGGNDGLNTIVPYRDDAYRKGRPKLQILAKDIIKIDDRVGLHPGLSGFGKLLQNRQLAVVQGVGYPNPNRSHFTSMAIWQSAKLSPQADTPGWLARLVDARPQSAGGDVPAVHVHDAALPLTLAGSTRYVPSFENLDYFRRRLSVSPTAGIEGQKAALDRVVGANRVTADSLLQFVQRTALETYATCSRLEGVLSNSAADAPYPEQFGLASRLRLIARLIKTGLSTSIYYAQLGGFDTHANQRYTHDSLLREVGNSLKAFLDDLKAAGALDRVLVLVFSEFGRRLAENASGGTDHGTAAPVFLLGQSLIPGLHAAHPDLQDLQDGDPKHTIDFRRVYATLLDQWLNVSSAKVLGERFALLPVIRG